MCDNLDVEGKRGVPWSGQSLNTVVGSRRPARASWTPTYAPQKERDHVVLHVLRIDQVFAKDRKSSYFPLKSSKTR